MALVNRDRFPLQFERNITRMVKEGFNLYEPEYQMVARIMNAGRDRKYQMAQFTGLGQVREIPEGSAVEFDLPAEGHNHLIEFAKNGLGFQVTEEMAQDTLHPMMLSNLSTSLGEQHAYRQDLDFWRLFVNGDSTTYRTTWDGLAPFANNHVTLKSGDTINNVTNVSLTETSLQAAFDYYREGTLVSEEGIPLRIVPDMLIIGKGNHVTAYQLMNQMMGVTDVTQNSANMNDMTTNAENGYVAPYKMLGSKVLQQLITARGITDAWFLIDSKMIEAFFLWKSRFRLESGEDFKTGNALFKGTQRYGHGWGDYKAMYGSFVV